LFYVWQQTKLLDSKTMLHALQVNFQDFGLTTKNTIFRLEAGLRWRGKDDSRSEY